MINLDLNEAFKILEIDLTTDKRTIKAAYSRILKKYHPEEFPDLFIQINEAKEKFLKILNLRNLFWIYLIKFLILVIVQIIKIF